VKKKITIKRRQRLEGQIAKEAKEGNIDAALDLAHCGHKRTPLQRAVREYLRAQRILEKPVSDFSDIMLDPFRLNQLPIERRTGNAMRFMVNACHLCRAFLNALDSRDMEALGGIASEAEDFAQNPDLTDKRRVNILMVKQLFKDDDPMTVKQLAMAIVSRKHPRDKPEPPPTNDNYSQLRRIAKSVGLPLAKAKKGRPKKGDT